MIGRGGVQHAVRGLRRRTSAPAGAAGAAGAAAGSRRGVCLRRYAHSEALKGITLDLTGTIFTFKRTIGEEYRRAIEKVGRTGLQTDNAEQRLQSAFERSFREVSVSYPNFGGSRVTSRCFWEKVVQGSLDGANIINLREEERLAVFDLVYDDIYGTGGANTYDVYPDVRPFLERAKKRGIVIGAVTNADERYRTLVLPSLGLSDAMDFVITSKEFGIEKPDARIFRHAIGETAVAGTWAHIGDSEKRDYRGARNAGMRAVLLARRQKPSGTDEHPRSVSDAVDPRDVASNLEEALDMLIAGTSSPT